MLPTFFSSSFGFVLTAICWGCTNPFIKAGAVGIQNIKKTSFLEQLFFEFVFLVTNWKYVLPLLLNLSGSAVYYLTLADADITIAVPIVNSLALAFTQLVEIFIFNKVSSKAELLGICIVIAGVFLCIND
ncbi:hypothetical protein BB561_002243 [Smittium simulii]|uniref:EamA domain-containing protein n=1 Tax=Smittium simulii TaxID=133385 RepID=A0A2T9YR53_9FUNG|nr:hypothetical protein BB561_002243 [Smittium simulii]